MKQLIQNIPALGSIARGVYRRWIRPPKPFAGSRNYWIDRYEAGGNSGDGSYGDLARFKARVVNTFVAQHDVRTVIEYGCGDGSQLHLACYPCYTGFDISPKALSICREAFPDDATKAFRLADDYAGERAELTLSLDVIYHLIEDDVFEAYMNRLFDSAERFVIIYASDTDVNVAGQAAHVRHRNFTRWVAHARPDWKLTRHIPNEHPYDGDTKTGSAADFYVYEKA